ncbi:Uma2 family endonuclease [Streptomyces sp. NPDC101132]|uniref:Uma2 family endonuclease n=1 Tax=Streptomyces sp. NPDC101132 TaxID=3366110 RepID=UPI0037F429F9
MTAAMVDGGQTGAGRWWDYLLQTWRELDVPDGWRAEIDEGQIRLVPPPHAHHNAIVAKIQRALYRVLPEEWEIYQTLGIQVVPLDKVYVPDLVVMPSALVDESDPAKTDPVDAAEALLVAEVTSKGNAQDDRTKKLWAYAHAPVPLYLLVDRFDEHGPTATLFAEPENGAYTHIERIAFGKPLVLPEPFGLSIDTAAFPH